MQFLTQVKSMSINHKMHLHISLLQNILNGNIHVASLQVTMAMTFDTSFVLK